MAGLAGSGAVAEAQVPPKPRQFKHGDQIDARDLTCAPPVDGQYAIRQYDDTIRQYATVRCDTTWGSVSLSDTILQSCASSRATSQSSKSELTSSHIYITYTFPPPKLSRVTPFRPAWRVEGRIEGREGAAWSPKVAEELPCLYLGRRRRRWRGRGRRRGRRHGHRFC